MLCERLTIRSSQPADRKSVLNVESRAYGRKAEANLVDQLLPAPEYTISIVAECDGKIIGHILLTEIEAPLKALALAPLAVIPEYREMHVGTELVRAGIEAAASAGYEAIFVLGDVLYYERFGFSGKLADPFRIKWQGKQFMALELSVGCLKGKKGRLVYPSAFSVL